MSPHSSTQLDEAAAPSTRLSLLSNRIKNRLALRRLYFSSKPACGDKSCATEEESGNEDRSSDSESSSDTPAPKPATVSHTRHTRWNQYYWNRPRMSFGPTARDHREYRGQDS
ncbi:hypothetical protein K438DRAFT_671705 [Mycena galopus ATCC 62051]|nr:hypothetical protein K438DRAFT_671705 [Mycena galopus ATCC 62051]